MHIQKIAVCGLGKLGSCIAAAYAQAGLTVVGLDTDVMKVDAINEGRAPVDEPGLAEIYATKPLRAVVDVKFAVEESDACFFVLPTPSNADGTFDDSYLYEALRCVATAAKDLGKKRYAFIVSSTVSPGTCDGVFVSLLTSILGDNFSFYYKPEFIALGRVLEGLRKPDLILLGHSDVRPPLEIAHLFKRIAPDVSWFHSMTFVEAELAKLSLNCFITMKISFANQIGIASKYYNANPDVILRAVGSDRRVGHHCLRPGLPFGGPCFPRDNRAFIAAATFAPLADATDKVNAAIRRRVFRQVQEALAGRPKDTVVGILGLAYKPETPVTDESLGVWLRDELRAHKIKVFSHDPWAPHDTALEDTLSRSTVLVIACPWPAYESIELRPGTVLIDPANVHRVKPLKEAAC